MANLLKSGLWAAVLGAAAVFSAGDAARAASAMEVSTTERAEVRLISDHDTAAPGETVALALHQILTPAWHSYWRNPGDSGLETTIAWTAPEGIEIGPIEWPAPYRVPVDPFMNYGYHDEAVLISRFTVPEDWPVGDPIEITAQADWLVCAEQCIPESQAYSIFLYTDDAPQIDAAAAEVIARGEASQPAPLGATAQAVVGEKTIRLRIDAPELAHEGLSDLYFFAQPIDVVTPSAEQSWVRTDSGVELTMQRGYTAPGEAIPGILRATDSSGGGAVELALSLDSTVVSEADAPPAATTEASSGGAGGGSGGELASAPPSVQAPIGLGMSPGVLAAAALAFLGGLILNLMPCVFPVLALKALSFAKGGDQSVAERRGHGLAYGGGVLVSFLGLAAGLIALKAAGATVGWGFQLQAPIVVAILAYVLVLVGLNLSGVFEMPSGLMGVGGGLAAKGGHTGSFFTGVLAVAVASPCTAPFMGAALGYALTQDAATALIVFAALGLGFAAPLVALSMAPGLSRALPRPGPWMDRFRQALAFPMYLAAAWLLWVLGKQAGMDVVFAAMVGLILLGLAVWALGAGYPASRMGRGVATIAALLGFFGAALALGPTLGPETAAEARVAKTGAVSEDGRSEPYDPERLAELREQGRTVFVNLTADWCISCKFNERMVLSTEPFHQALEAADAVYMVGDWTRRDPEITAALESFGRVGVPLYVVYRPGAEPVVLPQILTESTVIDALNGA